MLKVLEKQSSVVAAAVVTRGRALLTQDELVRMPTHALGDYRVNAPEARATTPVVQGVLDEYVLRPGLAVQCADLHELTGMTVETTVEPGLGLVVLLDGGVDVWFDRCRLQMNASQLGAQGACIHRREATHFVRRSKRGTYARKVSLSISHEWLDTCGLSEVVGEGVLDKLLGAHLTIQRWQPSRRAVLLAEELIHVPAMNPMLRHLYVESRSLALAYEALSSFFLGPSVTPVGRSLPTRDFQRMQSLRELLESGAADGWDMELIARHVGMNPTSLQRAFRQAFGTTVFDYVREFRLERARLALERGELNVTQAAELAGYASAANFSTAYRRQFGISPKCSKA